MDAIHELNGMFPDPRMPKGFINHKDFWEGVLQIRQRESMHDSAKELLGDLFKGLPGSWPDRSWGYADKVLEGDSIPTLNSAVYEELDRQYKAWKAGTISTTSEKTDDDDDFVF